MLIISLSSKVHTFMLYRFLYRRVCTETYMSLKSNDDQRSNKIIFPLYTSMNLVVECLKVIRLKGKKMKLWNAEVTKMAKVGFSRSFICVKNWLDFSIKKENNFYCGYYLITSNFEPLYFVNMCPSFVISKTKRISFKPGHFVF